MDGSAKKLTASGETDEINGNQVDPSHPVNQGTQTGNKNFGNKIPTNQPGLETATINRRSLYKISEDNLEGDLLNEELSDQNKPKGESSLANQHGGIEGNQNRANSNKTNHRKGKKTTCEKVQLATSLRPTANWKPSNEANKAGVQNGPR